MEPEWQTEIISRIKSVLYASVDRLREHGMSDNKDVATFEQLLPRNQLTHQLFDVVTGQVESKHEAQFETLVSLLRKIEVWWVVTRHNQRHAQHAHCVNLLTMNEVSGDGDEHNAQA